MQKTFSDIYRYKETEYQVYGTISKGPIKKSGKILIDSAIEIKFQYRKHNLPDDKLSKVYTWHAQIDADDNWKLGYYNGPNRFEFFQGKFFLWLSDVVKRADKEGLDTADIDILIDDDADDISTDDRPFFFED